MLEVKKFDKMSAVDSEDKLGFNTDKLGFNTVSPNRELESRGFVMAMNATVPKKSAYTPSKTLVYKPSPKIESPRDDSNMSALASIIKE